MADGRIVVVVAVVVAVDGRTMVDFWRSSIDNAVIVPVFVNGHVAFEKCGNRI